jgi:hypothetical protein
MGREGATQRRFDAWYAAVWVTIALSVLKGIRLPNLWSATHFYFNYQEGFAKRALVGEIIRRIDARFLYSYRFVCIASLALFALNVALLWGVVKRLLDRKDLALSCFAMVYTTSLALVFLAHTVGYFDHIGLALALITMRIATAPRKIAFLAVFGSLAILVHEGTFLLFLPTAYLGVFFAAGGARARAWSRVHTALAALVAFHALLTVGVGLYAVATGDQLARMQEFLRHKVDFPLNSGIFDMALGRAASVGWERMHGSLVANLDSIFTVLPALAVINAFTVMTLAAAPRPARAAALLAGLSPLAMHALGVDMHRWDTLALTTSFLSACLALEWRTDVQDAQATAWWNGMRYVPLLVALIAINASSKTFLFDGESVKQFPFFEHRKHLVELLHALRHH